MTPINKVPVGKFVRFAWNVVYVVKNDFENHYILAPIEGYVPQDKGWGHKVYVYKRLGEGWANQAKVWVNLSYDEQRIDNLTYIENLDILKSYGI